MCSEPFAWVILGVMSGGDKEKDLPQKKLQRFVAPMLTEEIEAVCKGFISRNTKNELGKSGLGSENVQTVVSREKQSSNGKLFPDNLLEYPVRNDVNYILCSRQHYSATSICWPVYIVIARSTKLAALISLTERIQCCCSCLL